MEPSTNPSLFLAWRVVIMVWCQLLKLDPDSEVEMRSKPGLSLFERWKRLEESSKDNTRSGAGTGDRSGVDGGMKTTTTTTSGITTFDHFQKKSEKFIWYHITSEKAEAER